jgi:hypothetical protein
MLLCGRAQHPMVAHVIGDARVYLCGDPRCASWRIDQTGADPVRGRGRDACVAALADLGLDDLARLMALYRHDAAAHGCLLVQSNARLELV